MSRTIRRFHAFNTAVLIVILTNSLFYSCWALNKSETLSNYDIDKEILDNIVLNSKYDKRQRPIPLTKVKVQVLLDSVSTPDESSLNFEIEFILQRSWKDPRLKFNGTGRYGYINGLSHADGIWMPNTNMFKYGGFNIMIRHMNLRMHKDGLIIHASRIGVKINCMANMRIFPFDNPKCTFAVESVALEQDELELEWDAQRLIRTTSFHSLNAYLISNISGTCDLSLTSRSNYSCLYISLISSRDKNYYITTVFLPEIILVTSVFLGFWLDKGDVSTRVTIGVTSMLSYCTTMINFRSTLPVVSNLEAMNLWDGVCLFFIYTSFVEYIVVNYLYRSTSSKTSKDSTMRSVRSVNDKNVEEIEDEKEKTDAKCSRIPSKELSYKIEGTVRIVFPISFGAFLCYYIIAFVFP